MVTKRIVLRFPKKLAGKKILLIGPGRGPTAIEIIRASDEFENLDEIEDVVLK